VLVPSLAFGAAPRPITESDLLKFRWVADVQISPDGRQVAYTLVTVNEKEDRYETSIWAVETSGNAAPRPLTSGPRDSAPRWSPDSKALAFLRSAEKKAPQIHLLSMSGGEARALTDLPKGTSAAFWSPNGRTIAFTSSTSDEDLAEEQKSEQKKGSGSDKEGDKKSDVKIVAHAAYRDNDEGLLDYTHHDHIWIVPVEGSSPPDKPATARRLTSGSYDEGDLSWAQNGSRIFFASQRVDEPEYLPPDDNVYSVPAAGGKTDLVVDIDGPIGAPTQSPDGTSMAFFGFFNTPVQQSYTKNELLVSRLGEKPLVLTAGTEFELGNDVLGDQHPPRGGGRSPILWTPDGKDVIVALTEHGHSNLYRVDVGSRRIDPVTSGDHEVWSYSSTPDSSKIAAAIGDATHLADVYTLETSTGKLKRLTNVNEALWSGLKLSEPERIWYTSFDGKKIEAWVVKPPDFSPSKKYPLILNIHGGPHTAYGDTFFHEFQWMAAKGYVVLAPNPRGSTSYGQDFGNVIQYHYPGDDFKDLMAGVDELVRRGYIDEKKLGVTGGSGGGLLTNWTVTQTNRFAAAVSQRSIGDWAAFWYSTDFTLFTPFWFRKYPFQDPEEYRQRSPVTYVEKVQTPLMLIEGQADLRSPTDSGGGTMFRALKALHKPTVMIVFPGETHELSRSGKPSHRIERLRHIVNWFDRYLMGVPHPEYDIK
jgi:dipeptidyl aminopeptidase/acylaminoacyl peptidase